MRSLGEIIDLVKDGEKPDYEELRYAVAAMEALMCFDRNALSKLAQAEKDNKKPILANSALFQFEEHFNRIKRAYQTDPKTYVGINNDPDRPEVQKRRVLCKKIAEKAISK